MDKVILIKYGELSTKKGNRNFFIKTLYDNLESKLAGYHVNISKDRARMYIEFNDDELDDIKNIIDKTFGIHMYHIANIVDTDLEVIKSSVLEILKNEKFSTFKVEVRRSDKSFEVHSQDMNRVLGGVILRNIPNISVDVHNPDLLVQVEIREKHSYIYSKSGDLPNHTCAEKLLGGQREVMPREAHHPQSFAVEFILAKRCMSTHGRILRYIKYRL